MLIAALYLASDYCLISWLYAPEISPLLSLSLLRVFVQFVSYLLYEFVFAIHKQPLHSDVKVSEICVYHLLGSYSIGL